MKNPNPVNLQSSAEVRERGWQAESRDTDGHLISCHAPIEADDRGIAEWIVECTSRGETVTFWPTNGEASAIQPPTPSSHLRVKPLQWVNGWAYGLDLWKAAGYEISRSHGEVYFLKGNGIDPATFDDLASAQSVAQTHHETHVWTLFESLSPQPNVAVVTDDLRKKIMFAIFDPGASEGFKGDRDLTTWQTDAVVKVLNETLGGAGDDCSHGKGGAWPPLEGASNTLGNDSLSVVTAGETAPLSHLVDPQPCGIADPSTRDCPNMKEVGGGMDGERYRCDVCGKGYFLDYEEMK